MSSSANKLVLPRAIPGKYRHKDICLQGLPELTHNRLDAVLQYSQYQYDKINKPLRSGTEIPNDCRLQHKRLKSLLCPIKNDVILWRGTSIASGVDTHSFEVDSWIDPAWVSTSMVKSNAREFGGVSDINNRGTVNYLMRLQVPAGIKAVPTSSLLYVIEKSELDWYIEFLHEREITLQPGLMYKVVNRRKARPSCGAPYVHLDVAVSLK